jgi:hypothetical protein
MACPLSLLEITIMSRTLTKARVNDLVASIRSGRAHAHQHNPRDPAGSSAFLAGWLQGTIRSLVRDLAGSDADALIEAAFSDALTADELGQAQTHIDDLAARIRTLREKRAEASPSP